MRTFFKIFFASLLSLIVFTLLSVFIIIAMVGSLTSKDRPVIADKSVLVINLSQTFRERKQDNPLAAISEEGNIPGLYDVVRLVNHARTDGDIAGIYIEANDNANGFASSFELRQAILEFRKSKKFVMAQGDMMSQGAYFVASAADRVYVQPTGNFDFRGYSVAFAFVKDMLEKLDIQPQIYYAGKYKSATEIFRTNQMTPENRMQTTEWLNDLYSVFLSGIAQSRGVDTATLRRLANSAAIRTPEDAAVNKLIDGVKYDDEIKTELKQRLGIGRTDKLNMVSVAKYSEAVSVRKSGSDRIALIYAEGNIVDGEGSTQDIGGDRFRAIIRKARLDKSVRAIVLRVNSGGGSALASENIWREVRMARQDGKPVVVSFGDVAASGGYYIACGADSIFCQPNTITGSIGVFGVIPNMGPFFKNKLGITFDAVKTGPYADAGAVYRPLTPEEGRLVQTSVERTYQLFKQRVAEGRKRDTTYIESVAQGRVWSGADALQLGLVDRIGGLEDAIRSAGRLAKLSDYGVKEYPESSGWLDNILGRTKEEPSAMLRKELGEEAYRVYMEMVRIRQMTASVQARMPFEMFFRP